MTARETEKALRARIAALEAQVEQLQLARPPRERDKRVELLFVNTEQDLFSVPADLALQILDALPVQIFIKRASKEPHKGPIASGRRYTFLNRMAAGIAGWHPADASRHLDCEAMADEDEYLHMESVETQTIQEKKRRDLPLRWTTDDGSWRVNNAIQLPIVLRTNSGEPGEAVGFCAIAHDIEFHRRITATRSLMRIIAHEVANLAAKVGDLVRLSERRPPDMEKHLRRAAGWIDASAAIAEAMVASYEAMPPGEPVPVQAIVDRLRRIFDPLPANIEWSIDPGTSSVILKSPAAVRGILAEVIRNAIKHTTEEFLEGDNSPVSIAVFNENHSVIWKITNKCSSTTGSLRLDKSLEDLKSPHMGGTALMDIIAHAYLTGTGNLSVAGYEQFIRFIDLSQTDQRVVVEVSTPIDFIIGDCK